MHPQPDYHLDSDPSPFTDLNAHWHLDSRSEAVRHFYPIQFPEPELYPESHRELHRHFHPDYLEYPDLYHFPHLHGDGQPDTHAYPHPQLHGHPLRVAGEYLHLYPYGLLCRCLLRGPQRFYPVPGAGLDLRGLYGFPGALLPQGL